MTLLDFYHILLEVGITVSHYEAELDEYPYIFYQELVTSEKYLSGQPVREDIKVDVVHFTKKAFDPSLEKLKQVLRNHKIGFTITHGYDPEIKDIINQFDVTITRNLEVEHDQSY